MVTCMLRGDSNAGKTSRLYFKMENPIFSGDFITRAALNSRLHALWRLKRMCAQMGMHAFFSIKRFYLQAYNFY